MKDYIREYRGFRVGDIVQSGNSFAKYIITGFHQYPSAGILWTGINCYGHGQGGSVMGSDDYDLYVIGHFNIETMLQAICNAKTKYRPESDLRNKPEPRSAENSVNIHLSASGKGIAIGVVNGGLTIGRK